MSVSPRFAGAQLETVRARIAGDLVGPPDDGYDTAHQAFVLSVDQRPAIVALPQSAHDVVEVVSFARSVGLRIAPRGTGHGAAPLEALDDAILLKTSRMPWHANHDLFNFPNSPADADAVLPTAAYDRLRQIKAHYDPTESIVHPVRPAASG